AVADDAHTHGVFGWLPVRMFEAGQLRLERSGGGLHDGHRLAAHSELRVEEESARSTRAGLPATMVRAGTSRATTLPAPTIACSPITTFDRIVAPEPIDAPCLTCVGSTFQSRSVCSSPSSVVARG